MAGGCFSRAAAARIRLLLVGPPPRSLGRVLPRRRGGTTGQRGLPATGVSFFFYFFIFYLSFFIFFM